MPYSGPDDPNLPNHVQALDEQQRQQWIAVFNRVLDETGDEGQAMQQANAAVKLARVDLDQASLVLTVVEVEDGVFVGKTADGQVVKTTDRGQTWTPIDPARAPDLPGHDAGARLVAFGGGVKTLGGPPGRLGGHLVLWGDAHKRDLQGEYFTPDSDLGLDWYPQRPLLYHHGLDDTVGSMKIGDIVRLEPDETGVWLEAQLDMRHRYADAVLELAERGALGLSSGTLAHLAKVEQGHVKFWPVVEGSLTPTPAEPRIRVMPLKALHDLPSLKGLTTKAAGTEGDVLASDSTSSDEDDPSLSDEVVPDDGPPAPDADAPDAQDIEVKDMNLHQLVAAIVGQIADGLNATLNDDQRSALIDQVVAEVTPQLPSGVAADADGDDDAAGEGTDAPPDVTPEQAAGIGEAVADAAAKAVSGFLTDRQATSAASKAAQNLLGTLQPQSRAPQGVQSGAQIQVRTKFADLSGADMAFYVDIMAQRKSGYTPSQAFLREMADKVITEHKAGKHVYLHTEADGSIPAMKAMQAIHADGGMKTGEVMHTTNTGVGEEWAADLWSNELWRQVRFENRVLSLFQLTDMPSNPYHLPIDGSDPVVYRVPETQDDSDYPLGKVTTSQAGTGDKTLTAYKLGARVPVSEELNEDSIVPVIPELRMQMLEAMQDAAELVVLHADGTTGSSPSGNINKYDAAVNTTDLDRWLLGFDGIAHLPLVDATTLLVDQAGAAPDLAMLRGLRRKLNPAYMGRLDNLAYVTDPITALKPLDIDQVLTLDKYGPKATVLTGELARLDNVPIIQSDQWSLADSTGKLSDTGADNTLGRVQLVYRPAFRVGYRRRVTAELVRFPLADGYQLVSFMRIAFIRRDDACASLAHNILV